MNKRLALLVLVSSGLMLSPMSHQLYAAEEADQGAKTEQQAKPEEMSKAPDSSNMEKSGSEQPMHGDCPKMEKPESK